MMMGVVRPMSSEYSKQSEPWHSKNCQPDKPIHLTIKCTANEGWNTV